MKILSCFKNEHADLTIREFDCRLAHPDGFVDLEQFIVLRFQVLEMVGGSQQVVINKEYPDIVLASEFESYPINQVIVRMRPEDSQFMQPNPPNKDRLRYWILSGQIADRTWQVIDRGYFYLDSLTAV